MSVWWYGRLATCPECTLPLDQYQLGDRPALLRPSRGNVVRKMDRKWHNNHQRTQKHQLKEDSVPNPTENKLEMLNNGPLYWAVRTSRTKRCCALMQPHGGRSPAASSCSSLHRGADTSVVALSLFYTFLSRLFCLEPCFKLRPFGGNPPWLTHRCFRLSLNYWLVTESMSWCHLQHTGLCTISRGAQVDQCVVM